jgi:OOP family OmpA-OmpF porin
MLQVLRHANVNFAKSSAQFRTSALAALDEIVEIAFDCPSLMIAVTGHTDATGNDAANRALSKARAESVVTYLAEHGVDPLRLSADGVGSDAPIASNENAAGRQINRRIEFGLRFR